MFFSLEDARHRLENTLISTKDGIPIYVIKVSSYKNSEYKLTVSYLNSLNKGVFGLDEVSLSPVTLGYINTENEAVYVSRKPCRVWKQGLSEDNFSYKQYRSPYNFSINVSNMSLISAISNTYPSVIDCRKHILMGCISQAFSRDFSLFGPSSILYKNKYVVGRFNNSASSLDRDDASVKYALDGRFFYLKEYLQEILYDPY